MRDAGGGTVLDPPGAEEILALSWTGWGGGPLHWTRSTISYSFVGPADRTPPRFAPSSSIQSLDASQQAGFESALAQWEAVANIDFVPYRGSDPGRADIRVGYADFPPGSDLAAVTWVLADTRDRLQQAEIWLNSDARGTDDVRPGSFGYLAAMHEVGHALGLGHPFEGAATLPPELDHRGVTIMSYRDHPGTGRDAGNGGLQAEPRTPMLYDIAVIQQRYGANMSHARGDDVYRFPDGMARIQTIWDAGGNDTIDASEQRLPVVIDLREGAYSSIGAASSYGAGRNRTAEDNLAIAFGAKIENAIGGRGDDLLVGNDLANRLEGGDGADILTGGGGADVLVGGSGADVFRDVPDGLAGDLLLDFSADDRITFVGVELTDAQLVTGVAGDHTRLSVDLDADGSTDFAVEFGRLLAGEFRVAAGAGIDTVVRLGPAPPASDPRPEGDGLDWVGTPGADRQRGTKYGDVLAGEGGNDRLYGKDGDDVLSGGPGNDRLYGDRGNDRLEGGEGRDRLNGGAGDDMLSGGPGHDRLYGRDGDDWLEGGDGADRLYGDRGDDVLSGGPGNDRLYGADGDDRLEGGNGADRLYGKNGNDRLEGGDGADRLYGDRGDDLLIPGAGDDRIHGGRGFDVMRVEGDSADFSLVRRGKVWILEDLRPDDGDAGRDRIKAVEMLQFDDVRLDISGAEAKPVDSDGGGGGAFAGLRIENLVDDGGTAPVV